MNKCIENIKGKLSDKKFIICLVGVALMIIGVFLPLYKIEIFGVSQSMNYFSNDGEMADGIFIIILAIIMLVLYAFNKSKFACIPAIISIILLIHCYSDLKSSSSIFGSQIGSFGIGFYTMVIGTLMAGICSLLIIEPKKASIENK